MTTTHPRDPDQRRPRSCPLVAHHPRIRRAAGEGLPRPHRSRARRAVDRPARPRRCASTTGTAAPAARTATSHGGDGKEFALLRLVPRGAARRADRADVHLRRRCPTASPSSAAVRGPRRRPDPPRRDVARRLVREAAANVRSWRAGWKSAWRGLRAPRRAALALNSVFAPPLSRSGRNAEQDTCTRRRQGASAPARGVGERRRPADEHGGVRVERLRDVTGSRPGARASGRRRACVDDRRFGTGDLARVVEVVGAANRHDEAQEVGLSSVARETQHRHQRDDPGTAADQQCGRQPSQTNHPPIGPRTSSSSPTSTTSCRNTDTSPSSSRSTVSSISFVSSGADATEYEREAV